MEILIEWGYIGVFIASFLFCMTSSFVNSLDISSSLSPVPYTTYKRCSDYILFIIDKLHFFIGWGASGFFDHAEHASAFVHVKRDGLFANIDRRFVFALAFI